MRDFSIAGAQVASVRGDVPANLATHAAAVERAAAHGVSAVVFAELSLTGYEPDLADSLAFEADDERLSPLLECAARHRITVVAGAPMRRAALKPAIGAFVLTHAGEVKTYLKMHLGSSEAPFFSAGASPHIEMVAGQQMGIGICADTSRESHPRTYAELGAGIYAAGVFLNEDWYATDTPRFPKYAADFNLLTVMVNHGASAGTLVSVGRSAIWAPGGAVLVEAAGTESALLIASRRDASWRGELVLI